MPPKTSEGGHFFIKNCHKTALKTSSFNVRTSFRVFCLGLKQIRGSQEGDGPVKSLAPKIYVIRPSPFTDRFSIPLFFGFCPLCKVRSLKILAFVIFIFFSIKLTKIVCTFLKVVLVYLVFVLNHCHFCGLAITSIVLLTAQVAVCYIYSKKFLVNQFLE